MKKKIDKVELLKLGATAVISIGVGAIVGNLVKHTTPNDIKKMTKLCIGVGSFVLSNMAGDLASKYMEGKIDYISTQVKKVIKEVEARLDEEQKEES